MMDRDWMSGIAGAALLVALLGMAAGPRQVPGANGPLTLAQEESKPSAGPRTGALGRPGALAMDQNGSTRPSAGLGAETAEDGTGTASAAFLHTLLLRMLLSPFAILLGWGFVTHAWINRVAWKQVYGPDEDEEALPEPLRAPKARSRFESYGALPDAISLFALVHGDHAFDACHCMVPYGHKGHPLFGKELVEAARAAEDKEALLAGYGWCAHQLADSAAHYWGYCESLPTFGSLFPPGGGQRSKVARRVLRDIDHGITEILADIVAAHEQPDLLGWRDLTCRPALVEEASTGAGGFPILRGKTWEPLLDDFRGVLQVAVTMARALSNAKCNGQPVSHMIQKHYDGPNGADAEVGEEEGLSGWRERAVSLVASFLQDPENPDHRPWEDQPSRAVRPEDRGEGGLPTGKTAGLPQRGGVLTYRLVLGIAKFVAKTIPLVPGPLADDWAFFLLRRFLDSAEARHTLMFRVAQPVIEGLDEELPLDEIQSNVLKALPPLVDTDQSYPRPGASVPDYEELNLKLELLDIAGDVSPAVGETAAARELKVDAVRLNQHPVTPSVQHDVKWLKSNQAWQLELKVGGILSPGAYEVQIEGEGPRKKPFRYEWEFSVVDRDEASSVPEATGPG